MFTLQNLLKGLLTDSETARLRELTSLRRSMLPDDCALTTHVSSRLYCPDFTDFWLEKSSGHRPWPETVQNPRKDRLRSL